MGSRALNPPRRGEPLIVCPLEFERRAIERAGVPGEVRCSGPGEAAVRRWANEIGPADRPVVLAGLAGALTAKWTAGAAVVVGAVHQDGGATLIPTMCRADVTCVVTSTGSLVDGPHPRGALHDRTGADIVDQESVAFAAAAERLGWRWGIVRGVSDAVHTRLPPGLEEWVDGRGRTRPARVAAALLRRPTIAAPVYRLRRDGLRALSAVAKQLRLLLANQGEPR